MLELVASNPDLERTVFVPPLDSIQRTDWEDPKSVLALDQLTKLYHEGRIGPGITQAEANMINRVGRGVEDSVDRRGSRKQFSFQVYRKRPDETVFLLFDTAFVPLLRAVLDTKTNATAMDLVAKVTRYDDGRLFPDVSSYIAPLLSYMSIGPRKARPVARPLSIEKTDNITQALDLYTEMNREEVETATESVVVTAVPERTIHREYPREVITVMQGMGRQGYVSAKTMSELKIMGWMAQANLIVGYGERNSHSGYLAKRQPLPAA